MNTKGQNKRNGQTTGINESDYISSFLVSEIYKDTLPQNRSWIQNIIVPKNTFGVFVTVERYGSTQKVHGCVGNWNTDYENITRSDAINTMIDVAKSAVFKDRRSKMFDPILEDPEATFKISWMINPVYPVDSETGYVDSLSSTLGGKYFDNNYMGLIVFSGTKRATYLPKVFQNVSWKEIKKSLIEKASLSTDDTVVFLSYFTKEVEFPFFKSFTGEPFCYPYVRFVLKETKKNKMIPYNVNKEGDVFTKEDEWIRNLAVIQGIRNLSCYNPAKDTDLFFDLYLKEVMDIFRSPSKKSVRQALTSAIEITPNAADVISICEYLFSEIDNLEPDFERQQVFISLLRKCKNLPGITINEKLIHNILSEPSEEKSIFRLNWEIQLLFESIKFWPNMNKYVKIIDENISNIVKYFNQKTMTNELAVAFEGISYLKNIKYDQEKKRSRHSLLLSDKYLMSIIILLWQRWNPEYGLFMFTHSHQYEERPETQRRKTQKHGNMAIGDSRIDITNHILNAQRMMSLLLL